MQTVDFKKYADIIVNLQMKNEFYWLIKHFDDKNAGPYPQPLRQRERVRAMLETFNRGCRTRRSAVWQAAGESRPTGARGQALRGRILGRW